MSFWEETLAKEREVRALLSRLTYKPGFRIWLEVGSYELIFYFEHQVPNADRKYEVQVVGGVYETIPVDVLHSSIPSHASVGRMVKLDCLLLRSMNEKALLYWLFQQIDILEDHEQEEFFRIDGKTLIDPHPEKAKT